MSEPAERLRARVVAAGRVQGVAFRYWTQSRARAAGVTGFVRNLPDGRVEAVFEGEAPAVRQLVELARRGPPLARVSSLDVEYHAAREEFADFAIEF